MNGDFVYYRDGRSLNDVIQQILEGGSEHPVPKNVASTGSRQIPANGEANIQVNFADALTDGRKIAAVKQIRLTPENDPNIYLIGWFTGGGSTILQVRVRNTSSEPMTVTADVNVLSITPE